MRTIKTYIKGAPFYIASSYRNVALGADQADSHIPITVVSNKVVRFKSNYYRREVKV